MIPLMNYLVKFLKIFLRCVAVLYIDIHVIKYKNFMTYFNYLINFYIYYS